MTSRRYIKRVWRVPKDRGAAEALGTLIVKALRKHGWPATLTFYSGDPRFYIEHKFDGRDASEDFWEATDIAIRIALRTYRIDAVVYRGGVELGKPYVVTPTGHFVEYDRWFARHQAIARKRALK